MKFPAALTQAKLIKRYKRFLADVVLADSTQLTIHCPNTGSMLGCNIPDSRVWFSTVDNPKRKYPQTWELIEVNENLIGINTHRANHLVEEAITNKVIHELQGYDSIRREVKYGVQNSRIDLYLEKPDETCYVEVKNVSLAEADIGYFPDAVTQRGTKHLQELMHMKQQGHRAVLCFCVQHTGIQEVRAAKHIDAVYADTLAQAHHAGVEVIAYTADISPAGIELSHAVEVKI